MAREMKEEIARIRHLRGEALVSAGLTANPPQSAVFDRPDEGSGYRIGKVQKRAFDEAKDLRARGLERRAGDLPSADQRRMAVVFSNKDRFANSFGEGAPVRSIKFLNDEFRVAAQSRFGVPLACLRPYTNQPLTSNNASATDKLVDAFGNNLKKTCGGGGWRRVEKPQLVPERHLAVVPQGRDPTPGGRVRHPRDLQRHVLRAHPAASRPRPPRGGHEGADHVCDEGLGQTRRPQRGRRDPSEV